MEWIIDRFEGDYAVILCGTESFNVLRKYLPENLKEKSIITLALNEEQTIEKLKKATDKMNSIFK